jgi:RNA polymerase sigma-70 factor (ECF subfamily)
MSPDVWEYSQDLKNLAGILCCNTDDSPDAADSVLVGAAHRVQGFKGEASMRLWIHAVTSSEAQVLGHRHRPGEIDRYLDAIVDGDAHANPPRNQDVAGEMEIRKVIIDGLAALPDNYRSALLIKEGRGLTVEQTAAAMGTSEASVRSVLYRARQHLRGRLSA